MPPFVAPQVGSGIPGFINTGLNELPGDAWGFDGSLFFTLNMGLYGCLDPVRMSQYPQVRRGSTRHSALGTRLGTRSG